MKLSICILYFLLELVFAQGEYTYHYLGCYAHNKDAVSVNRNSRSNSVDYCVNLCGQRSYKYAAVEFSSYCYCSNSRLDVYEESNGCIYKCAGNQTQICGGSWKNSVYEVVKVTTTPSATTTTTTPTTPATTPTPTTTPITTTTTATETTTTTVTTTNTQAMTTSSKAVEGKSTSALNSAMTEQKHGNGEDGSADENNQENIDIYVGSSVAVVAACAVIALLISINRMKVKKSKVTANRNTSYSSRKLLPDSESVMNSELTSGATTTHHVTANGDVYALVNKMKPAQAPVDVAKPEYSVTNEQREDNIYINSTDNSAIYYNTTQTYKNQSTDRNSGDDQIYSLAEPIIDDLVVVDNQLYETA